MGSEGRVKLHIPGPVWETILEHARPRPVAVLGASGQIEEGYAVRKFPDGRVHEGEWKDDRQHGKGKMTFSSGRVYEGEWKEGKRHGKGKE
jgi:hypothetical protein